MLDAQGRNVGANTSFDKAFKDLQLSYLGARLRFANAIEDRQWQEALQKVCFTHEPLSLDFIAPTGNRWWAHVVSLCVLIGEEAAAGRSLLFAFFGLRSRSTTELIQAFVNRHGLSRAEGEVLALLYAGNALQKIAELRGKGLGTVRTQLDHIFEKSGCCSQRELLVAVRDA